ncbi:hypothetical protein [Granulicoccus sp. GXG6511]|uniref:hypothetical protein n=1 Tax=Granulicoccus sp. GXG6511 TaxID=3381351 RepID=UPI003D7D6BF7
MSIRPTETSRIQPTSGAAATGTAPGTGLSPGTRRSLLTIIGITALLCVNAFVLSPLWILHPAEVFTDTAQAPTYFPTMRISWILLTIQVILLPALVRPGAKGTPPGRVLPLAQLGFATQAATLFYLGFFDSWLLPIAPEVLDLTDLGILGVGLNVVWVFYMVANVILAVALWRAGHSRVASVLMALGAVSTPFWAPSVTAPCHWDWPSTPSASCVPAPQRRCRPPRRPRRDAGSRPSSPPVRSSP